MLSTRNFWSRTASTSPTRRPNIPSISPGYHAVFFDDPINGIHWELAYTPHPPSPFAYLRWVRARKGAARSHPEWKSDPMAAAMRMLPGRQA